MSSLKPLAVAIYGLFILTPALAADVVQKVKPPVSQAYLDLATFSGGMLGSLFNKDDARSNAFGQTQGQSQGRWMDVVLRTRNNPNLKTATVWFVQAMGMRDTGRGADGDMDMVYWTSSELPDMGMGLVNYQPDSAMAMSRVIAYGDELNLAWPPRPMDLKITWEPQWNVKVRRKSVASLMPGMDSMAMSAHGGDAGPRPTQPVPAQVKTPSATDVITQSAFGLLRGVFKR